MEKLNLLLALFIVSALAEVQGGVIESRLLGSKDSEKGTHQYHMALFQKTWLGKETFVGSGALISDRWLITSAQVAKKTEPKTLVGVISYHSGKVKAGLQGLDSNLGAVQELQVEKVIIHDFYNVSGVADNDIALVKIKDPYFILNEFINNISYAEEEPKGQVVVTAWRETNKDKKPRQELVVDIKDRTSCGEALEKPEYIDDTVFCVENTGSRAVCADDSGSPAIINNGDQQYLVGIFAWVPKPGKDERCSTKPAIFTNIAWYRNWIKNNIS